MKFCYIKLLGDMKNSALFERYCWLQDCHQVHVINAGSQYLQIKHITMWPSGSFFHEGLLIHFMLKIIVSVTLITNWPTRVLKSVFLKKCNCTEPEYTNKKLTVGLMHIQAHLSLAVETMCKCQRLNTHLYKICVSFCHC